MWNLGLQNKNNQGGNKISRGNSFSTFNSQSSHPQDFSQDENKEFVIYSKAKKSSWGCFSDIDMMDLPINGSSVALKNSIKNINSRCLRLPIKIKQQMEMKEFQLKKCQFCSQDLVRNEKFVELPCRHGIHFDCIKKWTIISNPCRKCHK